MLNPNEQYFSYIILRTSYIQWDHVYVHFVLDHHMLSRIFIVLAHWNSSQGRSVAQLSHIIQILS